MEKPVQLVDREIYNSMALCLVTGSAGFIGSHVVQALLDREDCVIGLDNFDHYYDSTRGSPPVRCWSCLAQGGLSEVP